jgi:ABC-type glycerol-3-phosphate transport system substrate-binding protein
MRDNFQLIIIVVFIIAAIFGILVFSGAIPIGGDNGATGTGTVVLWGTVPAQVISTPLEEFNNSHDTYRVDYVEKSAATFDQELLEALASGNGPDLFFLPDDLAFHYANKIFTVPYSTYPIGSFKTNFVGAGEVFLNSSGIMAFPITVDPMVMYYNRSILDANNIINPPKDWEEFQSLIPTLTKKDTNGKIVKSAVALGHFANVTHAKEILAALFMQTGDKIITENTGQLTSVMGQATDLAPELTFYTDFADPQKASYSWNRSFPNSREYFSTDNLAFYFGYASELPYLATRNPNQNFLVAPVPDIRGANFKLTGGKVTGLALSSFSKNFNTAFIALSGMVTGQFAKELADGLGIAPARRDLLSDIPNDPYSPTFYSSALYARTFLDPSPKDTDNIFRTMVEGVLSNNVTARDAIKDASAKLSLLLIR